MDIYIILKIRALLHIVTVRICYSRWFRLFISFIIYLLSVLFGPLDGKRSDKLLMKAHRYCDSKIFQIFLERKIEKILKESDYVETLIPAFEPSKRLIDSQMIAAKPYKNIHERGILFLKYTTAISHAYKYFDIKKLLRDYYIILEPNWASYCLPEIMSYLNEHYPPVIIEASEKLDYLFLKRLNSNLIPVEYGPGNWINHNSFYPIQNSEKKYDCIMVAGWMNYKRHNVLFKALARLKKHRLKTLLVACTWYFHDSSNIRRMIKYYGLEETVTIAEDVSSDKLNILYNQSKVNINVSYKEGGNQALYEGMLANIPAIMLRDNIGINKDYINDCTGKVVEEKDLAEALLFFSKEYSKFNPREWAMANISCIKTTQKLNEIIKSMAMGNGEVWTEDMRVTVNCPWGSAYLDEKDYIVDVHLEELVRK